MDGLNPQVQSEYEMTLPIEPMDPIIRDLWAETLEGEEFEQGDEVLARGDFRTNKVQYCCLGVLCELAVRAGVIPAGTRVSEQQTHGNTFRIAYGVGQVELTLPSEVVDWAGLNMSSPRVNVVDDEAAKRAIDQTQYPNPASIPLETLNDNHHPFKAIAKLIRESL